MAKSNVLNKSKKKNNEFLFDNMNLILLESMTFSLKEIRQEADANRKIKQCFPSSTVSSFQYLTLVFVVE